jgi:hypothetical protein
MSDTFEVITETPGYRIVKTYVKGVDGAKDFLIRTHRHKKFLCVGGPLDGQHETTAAMWEQKSYHHFNAAGGPAKSNHTLIFVHKDLLP